ncbi:MAG: hypothetical protein Kow0025_25560 [Thermodesulfovibrionales bacterium]
MPISQAGEQRRLRRFLTAGAIAGAFLSIAISLLMDPLYSDALGGTWRDAIVNDLRNFLSLEVRRDSLLVTAILALVLSILGLFGAFMGLIFTFFVYKFFSFLIRD